MLPYADALFWLQQHIIEIIAVISGIIYIWLTIKEKILLWPFGILSSALYIWIFYNSGIYAYALLYIYYVVIGFYGWYKWSEQLKTAKAKDQVAFIQKASVQYISACLIITLLVSVPVFLLLKAYTDSDMAFIDAILTSGGMVATWMLTQKYIEQWLFWIVINLLSLAVMIYKELYPSSILFLLYTILAVKGYIEWKKDFSKHE